MQNICSYVNYTEKPKGAQKKRESNKMIDDTQDLKMSKDHADHDEFNA